GAGEEEAEGVRDLVVGDGDGVVDVLADDGEVELGGEGGGESVGDGFVAFDADGVTGTQPLEDGGGALGVDADDTEVGSQGFGGQGDAGDEPAAADGDDELFHLGEIFEDFEGDGALTGDDGGVGKGGDEGGAGVAAAGFHRLEGRADVGAEADLGAVAA